MEIYGLTAGWKLYKIMLFQTCLNHDDVMTLIGIYENIAYKVLLRVTSDQHQLLFAVSQGYSPSWMWFLIMIFGQFVYADQ